MKTNNITIPFNQPFVDEIGSSYVNQALSSRRLCGDGPFTKKVESILKHYHTNSSDALLTSSCTHALEMAAILLDFKPDDEVIVPAFTFTTTALAFYMHGATIKFSDIKLDTLTSTKPLICYT